MTDPKLKEWVDAEKKKGASDEILRQGMLSRGYSHEVIDEALGIDRNLPLMKLVGQRGKKYSMRFAIRFAISTSKGFFNSL